MSTEQLPPDKNTDSTPENYSTDNYELFYKCRECNIYYNKQLKCVQPVWNGIFTSGEPLRIICDKSIELLAQKECNTIVVDAREMKIITKEDQQWVVSSWYPRALKEGLRYEAVVISPASFNELTIKKIVQQYDETELKTKYFSNMKDAFDWVRNNFPE